MSPGIKTITMSYVPRNEVLYNQYITIIEWVHFSQRDLSLLFTPEDNTYRTLRQRTWTSSKLPWSSSVSPRAHKPAEDSVSSFNAVCVSPTVDTKLRLPCATRGARSWNPHSLLASNAVRRLASLGIGVELLAIYLSISYKDRSGRIMGRGTDSSNKRPPWQRLGTRLDGQPGDRVWFLRLILNTICCQGKPKRWWVGKGQGEAARYRRPLIPITGSWNHENTGWNDSLAYMSNYADDNQ